VTGWHVVPRNDLIEHELTPDCVCIPRADPMMPIYVHHSLDGREQHESTEHLVQLLHDAEFRRTIEEES
jgi:hypothetical protein